MNVFELFAKIGLDTSEYDKGLSGAEKSTTSFGDKLKKGLTVAAGVTTAAIGATTAVVGASAKAFLNAANSVSSVGDNIGDTAAKMGLSTRAYQEWDYVLQRAGSSIEALKPSMKTLANAATSNSDAFKKLGITQKELKSLNQEELFARTISALQNVENVSQRTALASTLLGRGATELGGIFNMTAEETEQAKQKIYELGTYMDEDAISASDNYQDTLADMKDSLKGMQTTLMTGFLPSITTVMEGLSGIFSGSNVEGGMEKISGGLKNLISKLNEQAPKFMSLAKTIITSLLQGFAPMLPSLVSTIFDIAIQAITTISSMIPSMMPSIISGIQGIMSALMSALPIVIDGISQLVMALATWLSEGDNVAIIVNSLVQLCSQIVNSTAMLLPVLIPMIVTIIGELANALTQPDNIEMLLDAVLTIIGALAVGIWNALPILAKAVTNVVKNLGNLLGRFFEKAVPLVADGIGLIVDKAKALGENIKTTVSKFFSEGLSNLGKFVSDIFGKLKDLPKNVVSIGSDLVKGLWNGISNMGKWIGEKIKGFGKNVTNQLKDFFKIKSPSRLFRDEIGQMLALGLGEGFERGMDNTVSDMVSSARNATSEIADAMSGSTLAMPSVGAAQTGSILNAGGFTINIYGAEGQDVRALAKAVSEELQNMVNDKRKAYGL